MAGIRPYVSKRLKKSEPSKKTVDSLSAEEHLAPERLQISPNMESIIHKETLEFPENSDSKSFRASKYSLPKSCIKKFASHRNAVNRIRWGSDLKSDILLSASMDSKILLFKWDKNKPLLLRSLDVHSGAVKDARWSTDCNCILSGGYDKHAKVTDANTGQEIFSHKFKDFVTSVLYHPTLPEVFLSGTSCHGIFAIDIRSGKEISSYKSFFGQVQDLIFHPNGKLFFCAAEILKRNSLDKAITAWDYESTAIMSNQISQEAFSCSCLQHHPNESVFLAQYGTGYISIYSNASPFKLNKYKRFEGHQTAGFNIGFSISPDGSCIISGDREGTIHIYDYWSSRLLKRLPAYNCACMDVAYHPYHPNVVASCSWDGEVSFWV